MYGINVESFSHLFFRCKVVVHVWKMCDLWVKLSFVHHNIGASHFIQFELQDMNKNCNKLQQCMWVVIIWCIWNQRHNINFRNARVDADEVFTLAQLKSWSWIVYKNSKAFFSYFDWCLCPTMCLQSLCLQQILGSFVQVSGGFISYP